MIVVENPMGQVDEKVSEDQEFGTILGGLTANYAIVVTAIRSQSNISYGYVCQMISDITGGTK